MRSFLHIKYNPDIVIKFKNKHNHRTEHIRQFKKKKEK